MKAYKNLIFMTALLSSQVAIPALAQDSDELDVTVVEANENAADVVNEIELPESASDTARMAVEQGSQAVAEVARAGESEEAAEAAVEAEEAALRAEQALLEATANANEAAAEAIKNALSSGASAEEILENIPADVMENLPEDIQDQLNEALDNLPEVEVPEVDTPVGG